MKKISIAFALAFFGLSATALATLPGATDPALINVPLSSGGLYFGASGYFLLPSNTNGDLNYALVNHLNTPAPNATSMSMENVGPSYNWGWGATLGYDFAGTANDIGLNYFQFNSEDASNVTISNPANQSIYIPNIDGQTFLGFHSPITSAHADALYNIYQLDLVAGQMINVGCRLTLHPMAGLRWASIERKLNENYSAPDLAIPALPNDTLSSKEESNFYGIGPIVGLDANYYIVSGLGVVAHADTALLVGRDDASTNVTQYSWVFNGITLRNPISYDNNQVSSTRRMVPVIDGKIAANYTVLFNDARNANWSIEAGWQFSHYFDAVDRLQLAATSAPFYAGSHHATGRTTSSLGLNGPYIAFVSHL